MISKFSSPQICDWRRSAFAPGKGLARGIVSAPIPACGTPEPITFLLTLADAWDLTLWARALDVQTRDSHLSVRRLLFDHVFSVGATIP
jgi:hypothetical protein